jgi:hydroxyacylglutathione hydrolase
VDHLKSLSAAEFKASLEQGHQPVVDVRKLTEYESEHVIGALNIPLNDINAKMTEFPADKDFYLHCAGGYRSVIASSILKSRGYHNLINVAGGMSEIRKTGMEFTNYVCPSTLK